MAVAPRSSAIRTPAIAPRDFLFVYGTLMRGAPRHGMLHEPQEARFLAPARAAGLLFDCGAYPGMVEGDGIVHGELYLVVGHTLGHRLDAYEAFDPAHPGPYDDTQRTGSEFRRLRIALLAPRVTAWVYLLTAPPKGFPLITDGRWRVPRNRRNSRH